MVWGLVDSIILHGKSHVYDLYVLDVEYFLFVICRLVLFLKSEYSREVVYLRVSVSFIHLVLDDKIHLSSVYVRLVKMQAIMLEQSLKGEFGNDIVSTEECVYRLCERVDCAFLRITVYDGDLLQDEGCEWLEVDLLEMYVSVKLVIKPVHDLSCDICLNLRELDDQYPRKEQCRDGDECQPEYFESPFDGLICLYMSQLAKIVKISDKIRIFAP